MLMTPQTLQKVSSAAWDWAELRSFCFSQALNVVRCPVTADEAAQQAIIRAWRYRESCREPERPHGWLSRIARNEALRLVALRPGEVLIDDPLAVAGETQELDRIETSALIDGVLGSLSPADQKLVQLRYYEDLTCASVADHLGTSEATVKVRLHRVRLRLRKRLEEQLDA